MSSSPDAKAQGPAAVFDRAVHLFGLAPALWLGRGLLPSVPFALGMFAAVYLHGFVWSYDSWGLDLLLRSFLVSGVLVLAWAFRGFGQDALFREAFAQADAVMTLPLAHRRESVLPSRRRASVGGILGLGVSLMLLPLCLLPGILFGASILTLGPVIAAEDRDLGSALRRTLRLAWHHPLRGVATLVFFGGVHFLLWLSVLLTCRGGVALISALFGVDLSTAELVFSPSNVPFLLGSGICAWLLLEPLWLLQRSLLYLDSVLGVSGVDLRETWEAIKADSKQPHASGGTPASRGLGATVGVALAALSLITLGCPGQAEARVLSLQDQAAEQSSRHQLITYAARMEALAAAVAERTPGDPFLSSPRDDSALHIDSEALGELLAQEGVLSVVLPGGAEVRLAPRAAIPPGANGTSGDVSRARAEVLAERLREAGAFARNLAAPPEPDTEFLRRGTSAKVDAPGASVPMSSRDLDLRAMLTEELRRDGYSTTVRARERRDENNPLVERFFEWLEGWFEGHEIEDTSPYQGSQIRLPAKAVVVSALTLFAVFAVVWGWLARGRVENGGRAPAEEARDSAASALPDARSRSVASWQDLAERAAVSGDHREAIRSLFLAVLAMLEGLREIEYRPSSSNGEHLNTFSGASSRRDNFELAVLSFELAWFGGQGAQAVDWERMLRFCSPLLRAGDSAQDSDG